MVMERVKWWGGLIGGVAAGVVVTAIWMEARAWRGEMERRVEVLEVGGGTASAVSAERVAEAAAQRILATGAAVSGSSAAGQGCEGQVTAKVPVEGAPGVGMSGAEWLSRRGG